MANMQPTLEIPAAHPWPLYRDVFIPAHQVELTPDYKVWLTAPYTSIAFSLPETRELIESLQAAVAEYDERMEVAA